MCVNRLYEIYHRNKKCTLECLYTMLLFLWCMQAIKYYDKNAANYMGWKWNSSRFLLFQINISKPTVKYMFTK